MTDPVQHLAGAALVAIIEDRASVSLRSVPESDARWRIHETVAAELRPLVFQLAEMAEHEDHHLVATAEYLHQLLEREPLRSGPTWEAQRVVLGLLLLGLTNALEAAGVLAADQRDALRPAYMRAATADVTAAFDETYVAAGDQPPEEGPATSTQPAAPPVNDDPLSLL